MGSCLREVGLEVSFAGGLWCSQSRVTKHDGNMPQIITAGGLRWWCSAAAAEPGSSRSVGAPLSLLSAGLHEGNEITQHK